jgi:hypothetical protein
VELLPWHGFSRQSSLWRHGANLRASPRDRAPNLCATAATCRIVDTPEIAVQLHRWAEIGERSHVAHPATEADRRWLRGGALVMTIRAPLFVEALGLIALGLCMWLMYLLTVRLPH